MVIQVIEPSWTPLYPSTMIRQEALLGIQLMCLMDLYIIYIYFIYIYTLHLQCPWVHCQSNCLNETCGATWTTNDGLWKAQMQCKQQDWLESLKRVSIQLILFVPMLFSAIHFVTNATSLILRLPSNLINLLVSLLPLVARSSVNSFRNTLLWPIIGTVAGQNLSGSGRFKMAAWKW